MIGGKSAVSFIRCSVQTSREKLVRRSLLTRSRVLLLIGAIGWLLVSRSLPTRAAPTAQVPIIQPDAITTPTAVVLVPTPLAEVNAEVNTDADTEVKTESGYHENSGEQRYRVQPGDTLLDVALETGVDLALLPCAIAPDFQPNQPLVIDDELVMPGANLICHQVRANETLSTIAANNGSTPASISAVAWNQLATVAADSPLPEGRNIRIPLQPLTGKSISEEVGADGSASFLTWMLDQPVDSSPFMALAVGGPFATQSILKSTETGRAIVPADQPGAVPENWPYGSGNFAWPLAGWLTQSYRYDHRAIDVAAPFGTTVTAADRGVVLRAGWNDQGYGLFVIIDHNIDYITLYGHLSEVLVEEGQVVAQGEIIGKVGSTGNSTGPHLHFEIRDFGRLTNPLELLVH